MSRDNGHGNDHYHDHNDHGFSAMFIELGCINIHTGLMLLQILTAEAVPRMPSSQGGVDVAGG